MGNGKKLDRSAGLRDSMVKYLRDQGVLNIARIEGAFRNVPRHLFLPEIDLDRAYRDEAISVKQHEGVSISSSSQPAMMAIMLEQLDLHAGHKVLEIGAGTGYNAAVMAHIVGEEGRIYTVELEEDLANSAREHIEAAGYGSRVEVINDDGGYGYPEAAPYDRIIITASAADILPSWWTQLKRGGRLVLPLSIRGTQVSVAFENRGEVLESASAVGCGFMQLRGEFAAQTLTRHFGPEDQIRFDTEYATAPDAQTLDAWLRGSATDIDTGVEVLGRDLWGGLLVWLPAREPASFSLLAIGRAVEANLVPPLFGFEQTPATHFTGGFFSERGMCVLMRPPDEPLPGANDPPKAWHLWVRAYGDDPELASRIAEQVRAWDAAGRPMVGVMSLRVFPARQNVTPSANEHPIPRRWTTILARWRGD